MSRLTPLVSERIGAAALQSVRMTELLTALDRTEPNATQQARRVLTELEHTQSELELGDPARAIDAPSSPQLRTDLAQARTHLAALSSELGVDTARVRQHGVAYQSIMRRVVADLGDEAREALRAMVFAGHVLGTFNILALGVCAGLLFVPALRRSREAWHGEERMRRLLDEKNAELDAALERARTASASKSRFLSELAEELRAPAQRMIATVESLLDSGLNPSQAAHVRSLRAAIEYRVDLANNLIDSSAIDADEFTTNPALFDACALIESVADQMQARASAAGVELWAHAHEPARGLYHGDAGRVRQLLSNFTAHAIQTVRGASGITLTIEGPEPHHDTRLRLRFLVSYLASIEQRAMLHRELMRSAESVSSGFEPGHDVRLAISRKLITALGGRVVLREEDSGEISVGFELALNRAACMGSEPDPFAELALRDRSILIAGHDVEILDTLEATLLRAGALVITTHSPIETLDALRHAEPASFDLIAALHHPPHFDALDLAARMRTLSLDTRTPMILLALHDCAGVEEPARAAGYRSCMHYPQRSAGVHAAFAATLRGETCGCLDQQN